MGDLSLSRVTGASPLGVQLSVSVFGVDTRASFEGVVTVAGPAGILVGDGFGVDCHSGEGDAGLSGLRNGDARGDPKERGEGLYGVDID